MVKGYLSIVLHAHLPFIRHPEHEFFLEEDWLFEATTETYIPLLLSFEKLVQEGIYPKIAISFSPTLAAMLEDSLLQKKYRRYVEQRLELCEKEMVRTRNHLLNHKTARLYRERFKQCLSVLDRCRGDILSAFKQLKDAGAIEILTCTATHGMLPLMAHPEALRAQISVSYQDYQYRFNSKPTGIWLGECAYDHRVGPYLKSAGFEYFFLDHHGITYSRPRPRYQTYAPVLTQAGVAAFGRDTETALQVWSATHGYPGDSNYREFYRDLGYDGEEAYIRPYLHPDGIRRNVGLKYHRVTGKVDLSQKAPYDPDAASATAERHAEDFLEKRVSQVEHLNGSLKIKPIVTAMYDAELFGHWWFEGPQFLEQTLRKIRSQRLAIKAITPSEYLHNSPELQPVKPEISSWGDKGYFEVWLNSSNHWIYLPLHKATGKMIESANRNQHQRLNTIERRGLNQAARELLLAQASDWAFMMTTGSHVSYAETRIQSHLENFNKLQVQISRKELQESFLTDLESKNNLFSHIDFKIFCSAPAL
ncbi:MAG: DUF1957 domain-containing protein [Elusimicrobia bacterium]|nr:DUF1957 domain-containing protein [Elusimicrobiota bacterium]